MKKLLSLLCILIVFTLFGCSDSQDKTQLYGTWQLKDFSSIVPKGTDLSDLGSLGNIFCTLKFLTPEEGKRPAGFSAYAAFSFFSGDIIPDNYTFSKDNNIKFIYKNGKNSGIDGPIGILSKNYRNLIEKTQSYKLEHSNLFLYDGEKDYEFIKIKETVETTETDNPK